MNAKSSGLRVLFYSHDTFGLGHLRRCTTIAEHLTANFPDLHAVIMTGANVASALGSSPRIEFVSLSGVVKTGDGRYAALDPRRTIRQVIDERTAAILRTAEQFRPDVFIVDKEPLGLSGEAVSALRYLKHRGTRLVLGLRDVLDDPRRLLEEWIGNGTIPLMEALYDDVWIYGPNGFHDPLQGIPCSLSFRKRIEFMGFLHRGKSRPTPDQDVGRHVLVTAGGGGDGVPLLRAVIKAYRADRELTRRAILVTGPYMSPEDRGELVRSGAGIELIELREFETDMESLLAGAAAVVGMGGYNTFCEILSFNKPALIVPRTAPRLEQAIRARRAAELGLVDVMEISALGDTEKVSRALTRLFKRPPPTNADKGFSLEGLDNITARIAQLVEARSAAIATDRQGGFMIGRQRMMAEV